MKDLGLSSRSDLGYFGGISLAAGAVGAMSRSLPRPLMPPLEADPHAAGRLPSAYPAPSPAFESERRGSQLPPPPRPEEVGRRNTLTPPINSLAESTGWHGRGLSQARADHLPASFASGQGSPSRPETSPTSQPQPPTDRRSFTAFNPPTRPDFSFPDSARNPGREQLPSLSQLLPAESVSSRSPYSSPWSAASPRSPRRSPTSGPTSHEAASLQASPFSDRSGPRPAPFAALSFHDPAARGHAHSIASFPSPPQAGPELAPASAAYHDRHGRHRYSDSLASGSSRWPPRSDPNAGSAQSAGFPPPMLDRSGSTTSHGSYASPAESPPAAGGDVIGPSIWTGTHFLPRFVGERDVPGEGPCFFYDDGSHCKTVIDGEAVNAHWGVTKAGKPRKRLAVACLTCREKKIKCDPDYPKCVQCEKFGRVCKFKNAPRGNRSSPEPFGHDGSESAASSGPSTVREPAEAAAEAAQAATAAPPTGRAGSMVTLAATPMEPGRDGFEPRKRRSSLDMKRHMSSISDVDPLDASQPNQQYASKKRRQSSPSDAQLPHLRAATYERADAPARASFSNQVFGGGVGGGGLAEPASAFHWQTDPVEAEPELVRELLEAYFRHINAGTYYIFPRAAFVRWATEARDKSADDLMLLYTMLALASNFSERVDGRRAGQDFVRIARSAVEQRAGRYTIQLAQSRLLLALHHHATNKPVEAWDCGAAAAATAVGLHLHMERPQSPLASPAETAYGLSGSGFAECRRRTFWTIYLMDRYNCVYSGHAPIVQHEDISLRLPSDEAAYEAQAEVATPTLDEFVGRRRRGAAAAASAGRVGPMAHLVQVASIWGDVLAEMQRASRRPVEGYEERYVEFYESVQDRLDLWTSMLPPELAYSRMNVEASIQAGSIGMAVAMHALYHATAMKVHRHVHGGRIGRGRVRRNICMTLTHGHELLRMMRVIAVRGEGGAGAGGGAEWRGPISTPFVGYAVTMACEVVSARGSTGEVAGLLEVLQGGLAVLAELKPHWSSARVQAIKVEGRMARLRELQAGPDRDAHMADGDEATTAADEGGFEMAGPLLGKSAADDDLLYGSSLATYLEALAGERKESQASTTGLISAMTLNAN